MTGLGDKMPSPEKIARELQQMRAMCRRLERMYKTLYVAAKHGSSSGGSLGQIGSGSRHSDPTADKALAPAEARLRRGVTYCAWKVRDAASDLRAAESRYEWLLGALSALNKGVGKKWNPKT